MLRALPNIISMFRICLVPVFVVCYIFDENDIKLFAVGIFIVAALSDALDGFIARKYNAQSQLGKILDPLGDKLITFAALICICLSRPVILWAVCLFFTKEVLMGIGGLIISKKAKIEIPPANILGKAATVLFSVICGVLLVFNSNYIPDYIAMIMVSAAVGLMLIAFIRYLFTFIGIMKNRKDMTNQEP